MINNPQNFMTSVMNMGTPPVAKVKLSFLDSSQLDQYEAMFRNSNPNAQGEITGEAARVVLIQSNLPQDVLARIWALASVRQAQNLTFPEFCTALFFVNQCLNGVNLPFQLPDQMKQEIIASLNNAGAHSSSGNRIGPSPQPAMYTPPMPTGMLPMGMMTQVTGMPTMMAPQMTDIPQMVPQMTGMPIMNTTITSMMQPQMTGMPMMQPNRISMQPTGMGIGPGTVYMSGAPGGDIRWAITPQEKAQYDAIFRNWDHQRTGYITGERARHVLIQSGLHENILAHIWSLADTNNAGKLNSYEFAIAMHLVNKKLHNQDLPTTLPPELIPPSTKDLHDLTHKMKSQVINDVVLKPKIMGSGVFGSSNSIANDPLGSFEDLNTVSFKQKSHVKQEKIIELGERKIKLQKDLVKERETLNDLKKQESDQSKEYKHVLDKNEVLKHDIWQTSKKIAEQIALYNKCQTTDNVTLSSISGLDVLLQNIEKLIEECRDMEVRVATKRVQQAQTKLSVQAQKTGKSDPALNSILASSVSNSPASSRAAGLLAQRMAALGLGGNANSSQANGQVVDMINRIEEAKKSNLGNLEQLLASAQVKVKRNQAKSGIVQALEWSPSQYDTDRWEKGYGIQTPDTFEIIANISANFPQTPLAVNKTSISYQVTNLDPTFTAGPLVALFKEYPQPNSMNIEPPQKASPPAMNKANGAGNVDASPFLALSSNKPVNPAKIISVPLIQKPVRSAESSPVSTVSQTSSVIPPLTQSSAAGSSSPLNQPIHVHNVSIPQVIKDNINGNNPFAQKPNAFEVAPVVSQAPAPVPVGRGKGAPKPPTARSAPAPPPPRQAPPAPVSSIPKVLSEALGTIQQQQQIPASSPPKQTQAPLVQNQEPQQQQYHQQLQSLAGPVQPASNSATSSVPEARILELAEALKSLRGQVESDDESDYSSTYESESEMASPRVPSSTQIGGYNPFGQVHNPQPISEESSPVNETIPSVPVAPPPPVNIAPTNPFGATNAFDPQKFFADAQNDSAPKQQTSPALDINALFGTAPPPPGNEPQVIDPANIPPPPPPPPPGIAPPVKIGSTVDGAHGGSEISSKPPNPKDMGGVSLFGGSAGGCISLMDELKKRQAGAGSQPKLNEASKAAPSISQPFFIPTATTAASAPILTNQLKYAMVLHRFNRGEDGDIDAQKGDIIEYQKEEGEWLEGKITYREKQGWIPKNYLRIISAQEAKPKQNRSLLNKAKVLHDFESQGPDECSIRAEQVVWIVDQDGSPWCIIEKEDGSRGSVPAGYIEILP